MKNERNKIEVMYAIEDLRSLLIASGDESDVIAELEKQNRKLRGDKATIREMTYILSEQNKHLEQKLKELAMPQLYKEAQP